MDNNLFIGPMKFVLNVYIILSNSFKDAIAVGASILTGHKSQCQFIDD